MKSKSKKFSPTAIGLKRKKIGYNDFIYEKYDKDKRLLGWITYFDYLNPQHWVAYKKIYFPDSTAPMDSMVYMGQISSNAFAKQLLKNIFNG